MYNEVDFKFSLKTVVYVYLTLKLLKHTNHVLLSKQNVIHQVVIVLKSLNLP